MASSSLPGTHVFTWNTQGDFTSDEKFERIKDLFNRGYSIGFIQEGGVSKSAKDDLTAYRGSCVGAYNERCSNYVLIESRMVDRATCVELQDGEGRSVIGGGVAGRAPAAIGIDKVLYVSWHSLAGESNHDTSMLVHAIESNTAYHSAYDTIIIGGDFNASPKDIKDVLLSGTDRTKEKLTYKNRCVANSNEGTHKPKGKPPCQDELDFFIIMTKETKSVSKNVTTEHVEPSDHCPVMMRVTFSE